MRTILELTAKIVSAHVANNRVPSEDVPRFLQEVHAALASLSEMELGAPKAPQTDPVVSVSDESSFSQETQSDSSSGDISASRGASSSIRNDKTALQNPLIPAVSIEDSVLPDRIVCLEDGKEVVLLKRYLRTEFGMTPNQYRRRWKLPDDYPMAAPEYSEQKRAIALAGGFGTTVRPSRRKRSAKAALRA